MSCLTPSKDVSRGKVWCRSRQPLPVSVLLNLELRTNKKWQVTISNDLMTKPANEEEVELAGGVGQPGGGEDAVVGRGGVDHLLQALHHLPRSYLFVLLQDKSQDLTSASNVSSL